MVTHSEHMFQNDPELTAPAEVCGGLVIFLQDLGKLLMPGSLRSHKTSEVSLKSPLDGWIISRSHDPNSLPDGIRLPCRYAREDALGKLGGAVAEGAQLIEDLYQAFYQELQKPLASAQAGPNQPVKDSTYGQSSRGAHESPQNEAAAKVSWQQIGTALRAVGRTHFLPVQSQAASHNRPAMLLLNVAVRDKEHSVIHYPVTRSHRSHCISSGVQ